MKLASELSAKVLVDAEYYSCTPAISMIALALMARYNKDRHLVGNTIQGYLQVGFPLFFLFTEISLRKNLNQS